MKSRMRAAFEDLRASTLLKMEEAPMEIGVGIGVGVEADILSDEVRTLLFLNVFVSYARLRLADMEKHICF